MKSNRLLFLLGALVIWLSGCLAVMVFIIAGDAHADTANKGGPCMAGCNYLKHYSPDDGYDESIKFRCDPLIGGDWYGTVSEGNTADCYDVAAVGVRDGEEVWCKTNGVWGKVADKTGYKDLPAFWAISVAQDGCTLRKD